ncbi:MAG: VWA domain-containing protein [Planctomycetota bacterium]
MTFPGNPPSAGRIAVGDRIFGIDRDRIHVLGSGERADVRLHHDSIRPAHAMLSWHDGGYVVEAIDGAPISGGIDHGDGSRHLQPGDTLRLGAIDLALLTPSLSPVGTPRAQREQSFAELMAGELRRAPWFAVSLALHAVAFLVLWLFLDREVKPINTPIVFGLHQGADSAWDEVNDAPTPEFEAEPTTAPDLAAAEIPVPELRSDPVESEPDSFVMGTLGASSESLFHRIQSEQGNGDILARGTGEKFSTGFRRTVSGLRQSGLEIVFAFDSTGSMGPVLRATKERMARMVRALHALVPDARIGVVTYRDRGEREAYVTRLVGLDHDVYRALNFLQTVNADGGGDRPEAVLEAVEAAIAQPWAAKARRVIVLIGDAPAHPKTEGRLERLVRTFARGGQSHVHAIITGQSNEQRAERDVARSFERITNAGNGSCVLAERDELILEQVLSLAVGSEFQTSVRQLFDLVQEREQKISTRALDMVRRLDATEIRRVLSQRIVDDEVVSALARSGRQDVALMLVKFLESGALPPSGRHAAGWALQSLLRLSDSPVDPENPGTIDAATAKRFGELAMTLRRD